MKQNSKRSATASKTTRSVERQSDQAFTCLCEAIIRCELAPGAMVSEPQLEEMFDFSRVALRVAIDRLAQLKLVHPLHRRGYRIAPITLRDVKNAFELRMLIEPPSARMAVGRVDLDLLRRVNEKSMVSVRPGDRAAESDLIAANREFHILIAEASNNDKLVALIEQVLRDIDRVYYFGLVRDPRYIGMQREHVELIKALEKGDGGQAEKIARIHIEDGYRIAMDAILNTSSLADTGLEVIAGLKHPVTPAAPRRRA